MGPFGMFRCSASRHPRVLTACLAVAAACITASAQQPPPLRFGGAYSGLDARRQALVDGWVARFVKTTGQRLSAEAFYNELLSVSTKTTFDAVTHALMTIQLTDAQGASLGDTLALVERVDAVRGEVTGTASDRQFRLYARLSPDAVTTLNKSQQFKRGQDNAVFHDGYPTNYREQGGSPSVQISIGLDGRRADIDVDYRSPAFPIVLFNGHLTSSNSDVRSGNNYDRHIDKWTGFQNWWRSFFGVHQENVPEAASATSPLALPKAPRIGRKPIDVAVNDFLQAWLVERDVIAAMGYISERSSACLSQDSDNPADFDRGMAPFQLMVNLKSANDALGPHTSLNGLTVGTRLTLPGLRAIRQPHHAQFVIYSVPDDVASALDCESRLTLANPDRVARVYGNYFGVTFYIDGRDDFPVALLWAQDGGYWKIVSWRVGVTTATGPDPERAPASKPVRISADLTLVRAARDFLDSWLARRDYDAAFRYIAPAAYACYDLERDRGQPAATSLEDAGRKLRASLEASSKTLPRSRTVESLLVAAEPIHPLTRVMDHPFARVFSLSSPPNALADAAECAARAANAPIPDPMPLEYGNAYGMTVRFRVEAGDAPVLRLLWRQDSSGWRITSYGVELP
jgi:hypothetical protein